MSFSLQMTQQVTYGYFIQFLKHYFIANRTGKETQEYEADIFHEKYARVFCFLIASVCEHEVMQ